MNIIENPAVKTIYLHQLRNDGHHQYLTDFRGLVETATPESLNISALWATFEERYQTLDEAYKAIPKSALTDQIHAADDARDSVFVGLRKLNKVMLDYHYDPAVREAARNVEIVLNTYGNVKVKALSEETSAVSNLVQDLKGERYGGFVTQAGLSAWVNKLELLNNNFETLVKTRDREKVSKASVPMKTARLAIDEIYTLIIQTLNSRIFLKELTGYETFVDTLNTVIKRYLVMIRQQRGHHHHHGTTPPVDHGTTPPDDGASTSLSDHGASTDGEEETEE